MASGELLHLESMGNVVLSGKGNVNSSRHGYRDDTSF